MNVIKTPIEGLLIIEPKIWPDDRGYFYESYNKQRFTDAGIAVEFVQDNQSSSQKGTLRGLHGQANPYAQGKLVRVLKGKVWDVAVDIRKGSPTYGQHFGMELTGDSHQQLWIPAGFLHGFLTLEDDTIFVYKITNFYNKESEIGVMWNDPDLAIQWPVTAENALLSDKDKRLPQLRDLADHFIFASDR